MGSLCHQGLPKTNWSNLIMQAAKADRTAEPTKSTSKFIPIAIILVILIVAGIYITNGFKAFQPTSLPKGTVAISQGALEEEYGLRVNLVAVTAAGGMVDLRLKMLDGEKAKNLLQDKKNFPTLLVVDSNVTLKASDDTSSQEIKFENNGGLFLLFPNSGDAVKPGSKVMVVFGDIQLEPIAAK
jgi:flagellar basal body-associated protein FliL